MHWVEQYLHKPWRGGATGPDAFDCWGLCVHVETWQYRRQCPVHDIINPRDTALVAQAIHRAMCSLKWVQTLKPVDGCIVAMSQATQIHHVGVYIADDGGMVLHCQERSGVQCQPLRQLPTFKWNRIEFYQHRTWLQ